MTALQRRDFLKTAAATTLLAAMRPPRLWAAAPAAPPRVVVAHGAEITRLLATGIQALGGWSAFVRQGQRVVLKVNAAWASTPEQGANTHPDLVAETIRACLEAGAASVSLPENTCSPAEESFKMSGIAAAVRRAGGRLYALEKPADFTEVEIPRGRMLRQAAVARAVLEAECLINLPVAKSHNGAILTLGLKNWMGAVRDRGFWHREGLHQCIVDFSTRIRPHLTIVDATRIMVTRGPRGPGRMEYPNQVIFGTDPVAVDAYAATLFGKQPFDIPYIQLAHEAGLGCGDLAQATVEHLTA